MQATNTNIFPIIVSFGNLGIEFFLYIFVSAFFYDLGIQIIIISIPARF